MFLPFTALVHPVAIAMLKQFVGSSVRHTAWVSAAGLHLIPSHNFDRVVSCCRSSITPAGVYSSRALSL